MNWLIRNAEIIGALAGLACVLLVVRQNVWNWPLGIINNVFFLFVLAQDRLYANAVLQAIFIALGFYGWWMWLYGGEDHHELTVSRSRPWFLVLAIGACLVATTGLALLFTELAQRAGLPPPDYVLWDSSILAFSLLAQWLLTWKKIENWWVWIVSVNLSQIALFLQKGRPWMAALQVAYIALSALGYMAWRAELALAKTPAGRDRP